MYTGPKILFLGSENSRIPILPVLFSTLYISFNDFCGSTVFLIPKDIVTASNKPSVNGRSSAIPLTIDILLLSCLFFNFFLDSNSILMLGSSPTAFEAKL